MKRLRCQINNNGEKNKKKKYLICTCALYASMQSVKNNTQNITTSVHSTNITAQSCRKHTACYTITHNIWLNALTS